MSATISVVCYKYKQLLNGESPLMLRVTKQGKRKYQSLGVSVDAKYWDFEKNQPKRNCPNRDALLRLISERTKGYQEQLLELKIENKDFTAKSLIDKVDKPVKRKTVDELFLERIKELKGTNRLGYAESHEYVYKSLLKFNGHLDIYFSEIDVTWLKKYEAWLRSIGNKENTIGIRFRTLRAVYNIALEQKLVKPEYYPFINYKVSKLHQVTAKRALTKDDVMNIIDYKAKAGRYSYAKLAIDIFTFSYFMGGINFRDIAYLTVANIMDNRLVYTRRKTKQLIKLPISSKAMEVIVKYKSDKTPYLFPILTNELQTESEQRDRIRQTMKSVNKHLKDIGEELNLPIDLTTYVARHSFATVLKRSGVNTSIICEAMGHSSEKVTQIYLDSFENEQVDAAMSNLL